MNAHSPYPDSSPQMAPSNDEKLMAALAHASALLPQFGLIAPLIIWLVNRGGRAPFAAYQAKQAFCFQLFAAVAAWVVGILGFFSGFLTLGLGWLVTAILIGLIPTAALIYGVIGAIQAFGGRDFRYWLVGDWVQPD